MAKKISKPTARPPGPPVKPKPYSRPVGGELSAGHQVDSYDVGSEHPTSKFSPFLPDGGPSPGPLPVEVDKPQQPGGNPSTGGQQQQNKPSR
jgi:hypothetical protein